MDAYRRCHVATTWVTGPNGGRWGRLDWPDVEERVRRCRCVRTLVRVGWLHERRGHRHRLRPGDPRGRPGRGPDAAGGRGRGAADRQPLGGAPRRAARRPGPDDHAGRGRYAGGPGVLCARAGDGPRDPHDHHPLAAGRCPGPPAPTPAHLAHGRRPRLRTVGRAQGGHDLPRRPCRHHRDRRPGGRGRDHRPRPVDGAGDRAGQGDRGRPRGVRDAPRGRPAPSLRVAVEIRRVRLPTADRPGHLRRRRLARRHDRPGGRHPGHDARPRQHPRRAAFHGARVAGPSSGPPQAAPRPHPRRGRRSGAAGLDPRPHGADRRAAGRPLDPQAGLAPRPGPGVRAPEPGRAPPPHRHRPRRGRRTDSSCSASRSCSATPTSPSPP